MLEQTCATPRADAGNILELAGHARLLATPTVAGDGKAVRFVTHLLDELQCRRRGAWPQLAAVGHDQCFVPCPALFALGHADQPHVLDPQVGQRSLCLRQLTGAAIDQQHVGQHAVLFHRATEATLDCLPHGCVIVARGDAGNIEASILATHRAAGIEHHARGDGCLAHRVADVEALHAFDRLGQPEHLAQGLAACVLRALAGELGNQGQLGVTRGQQQITGTLAAHVPLERHLVFGRGTEGGLD